MSKDQRALRRYASTISTLRIACTYVVITVFVMGFALLIGVSCGESSDEGVGGGRTGKAPEGSGKKAAKRREKRNKRHEKAGKASKAAPPPLTQEQIALREKERELPESVFIENDDNRDPFRSFLAVFSVQALPEEEFAPRPPVLLEDVGLEALRLIAIISGQGGNPRAMLVDPEGKGWVVRRGDYVGRGERIRLGPGQPEREINWRVVRVRPDRIILVREDPVQAGPPVTRVMRLYPEEEG